MLRSRSVGVCLTLATALIGTGPSLAAGSGEESASLRLKPGLWEVDLTYQSLNGRQVLDNQDLFARLLSSVDPTDLALDRVDTALAQSPCANEGAGEANAADSGGIGGGSLSQLDRSNTQHTQDMPKCTLPYVMRMKADASTNESGANQGASSSFRVCLTPARAQLDLPVLDAQDSCRPSPVQHQDKRATFTFSCGSSGTTLQGNGDSHRTFTGRILTLTDFTATTNPTTHYAVHDRTEMKYLGADCGAVKPQGP